MFKETNEEQIVLKKMLDKSGDRPELNYILTKRTVFEEECGFRESYTIICESDGENAVLYDVSSLYDRAMEMFLIFVENTVTPITAFDVIEEMI